MAELITRRIRRNAAELRLHAIAENPDELIERAETAQLGYREFLDLLLESEVGVLEGRRYQARLKMAGLPHHKTLDEFDITFQPELDAKRLAELRSLRFIERRVGCLILGPPGTGKTHIAVGLAMEALARGYLVRYSTLDDLVRGLRHADALGKLPSKLAQLQRPHLLLLDEAGYLPLDRADANRVFQVVNRRYTRGSTIITSNKTVSEWADTFGDEALAAAILDRLLHDAEVLAINGPSFRLKGRLDGPPPTHRARRERRRMRGPITRAARAKALRSPQNAPLRTRPPRNWPHRPSRSPIGPSGDPPERPDRLRTSGQRVQPPDNFDGDQPTFFDGP